MNNTFSRLNITYITEKTRSRYNYTNFIIFKRKSVLNVDYSTKINHVYRPQRIAFYDNRAAMDDYFED
jgi:hypothetical protein